MFSHISTHFFVFSHVQLRRHRSSQGLDTCHTGDPGDSGADTGHCHHHHGGNRHSVHFDSVSHAMSGLETLDFPVRKKTWPPDGPRSVQSSKENTKCPKSTILVTTCPKKYKLGNKMSKEFNHCNKMSKNYNL